MGADQPFDAVIVDMQMPVLDGLKTARQSRAEGYEGPIIALTANALKSDRARCVQADYDDFFTKPIDSAELVSKLAARVGTRLLSHGEASASSGRRIPCVDDSLATVSSQKILLEQLGHQDVSATTGREAFERIAEVTPDEAILVLGLKEITGGELLSQFKTRFGLAKCRYASLSGRSEDEIDWRALGFDAYL